jgi:hypothetical protein
MAIKKVSWMVRDKEIPLAVVTAIAKKFTPDMALFERIMIDLDYDSINGCYCFIYAGMYHGVEEDGYIHT